MSTPDPTQETLERLERAEQLKLDGSHEEALIILEELLIEDPENVSALEEIADNELSLGHFDRAETAATEAVALDPDSYTGYYILGFLRSREEKWEHALSMLRLSNKLRSSNPEILRCLGWALFHAGQRVQGVVTLERALNLDPDSTLTLCDLGVAYLQMQHFEKAKALFVRVLDLEPDNLRAKECIQAVERLVKFVKSGQVRQVKKKEKIGAAR